MKAELETAVDKLEEVKSMEELAGLEDEIAGRLGKGFLEGEFDYAYLTQIKERVEQIESKRRKELGKEIPVQTKRMEHAR